MHETELINRVFDKFRNDGMPLSEIVTHNDIHAIVMFTLGLLGIRPRPDGQILIAEIVDRDAVILHRHSADIAHALVVDRPQPTPEMQRMFEGPMRPGSAVATGNPHTPKSKRKKKGRGKR